MPRADRSASEGMVPAIVWEAVSGSSPRGRLCGALVLGATLAMIGPDRLARGPQICLISACIRRPCPACGITRAASALLRGDLRRAMRTNPRIILVAMVGGTILLSDLVSVIKRRSMQDNSVEQASACNPGRQAEACSTPAGVCDARSASPRQPNQWESVPPR